MRSRLRAPLTLASLTPFALAFACGPEAARAPHVATPVVSPGASVASAAPPVLHPSIDEQALDKSVSPCDDFYQYACGSWLKANPIPEDEAAWARSFSVIFEKNQATLRQILERDEAGKGGNEPYAKQLGDYYAACMDETGVNQRGIADLKPELARIDAIKDPHSLMKEIAHLHSIGASPLFAFDSDIDFKDATQVIGTFAQGGLGLPDRDYYLDAEAPKVEPKKEGAAPAANANANASANAIAKKPSEALTTAIVTPATKKKTNKEELREFYEQHVAAMLALAGDTPAQAQAHAKTILRIETQLAKGSMSKVDLRDPQKVYHRLDRTGLKELAPRLEWDDYFGELGVPNVTAINVAQPEFAKVLNEMAQHVPLADFRTYLRWNLIRRAAPSLDAKFVDQDFKFQQRLRGAKTIAPRWKRCVRSADGGMGEALAQPFVKETLGVEGKAAALTMVHAIEGAMQTNLEHLAWMDEPTRQKAIEKLGKIRNKIAFPDKWRSYDGLEVDRASYWQNRERASAFEVKRQLAKIGKPVDKDEWEMTPPTVNAYYEPTRNEIVFPAGILQPPMYGNTQTRGMNFGGIGLVVGHEITHGFDDEGRQFDGNGNLKEWWSPRVGEDFDKRAACVVAQFDGYVAVDDAHVNGKLTLGENIADLGGLKLAYSAFKKAEREKPAPQAYTFSEDQQFFLSFAQSWCDNIRPEYLHTLVATNPHSPAQFRVNGPLSNFPEFAATFSCKAGDKMVRPNRCEVW